MQSRNEIVHTVLQFKSRTISFLFLRMALYVYCSIILRLWATPNHGTLSHHMQQFWLLKPQSISRESLEGQTTVQFTVVLLVIVGNNILVRQLCSSSFLSNPLVIRLLIEEEIIKFAIPDNKTLHVKVTSFTQLYLFRGQAYSLCMDRTILLLSKS